MEGAENPHPDPPSEPPETPTNPNPSMLGRSGLIDRTQFIRIIIQAIYSLGFKKVASSFESESGLQLDSSEYKSLMSNIKSGRWEDCIATIKAIDNLPERTRSKASFLIWSFNFLELLRSSELLRSNDDMLSALEVLRKKITPFAVNRRRIPKVVRRLACRLISLEWITLYNVDKQRSDLSRDLAGLLSPWLLVPSGRLEHLVEMAVFKHRASCIHHYDSDVISLYEDCFVSDQILFKTVQILSERESKVQCVQFSNKGEYLAASSTKSTAIIWTVNKNNTLSFKHALKSQYSRFSSVAWSPDDTMLLSCFNVGVLMLWDVDTGTFKDTFDVKDGCLITSFAWFPDSRKVVCGCIKHGNCIYMYDLQDKKLMPWKGNIHPATHLAVTPDGQHLIIVSVDAVILIRDLEKGTERFICESHLITSLSLSRDGRFLIVNLEREDIHLWALDRHMIEPWRYTGHKQVEHYIMSCFGGLDCSFIASGSEDSQVYIWQRENRRNIQNLPGHSRAVTCVSWNPMKPQMLASASDDGTIRIWLACRKFKGIST